MNKVATAIIALTLLGESSLIHETNHLIILREGDRRASYNDSLGNLTAGIGHLLTSRERLVWPLGAIVPQQVRDDWFTSDYNKAVLATNVQLREAKIDDPAFALALESVNFQLGSRWIYKFPITWKLIKQGKYLEAADEVDESTRGRPSLWEQQTPVRVDDFQAALMALHIKQQR